MTIHTHELRIILKFSRLQINDKNHEITYVQERRGTRTYLNDSSTDFRSGWRTFLKCSRGEISPRRRCRKARFFSNSLGPETHRACASCKNAVFQVPKGRLALATMASAIRSIGRNRQAISRCWASAANSRSGDSRSADAGQPWLDLESRGSRRREALFSWLGAGEGEIARRKIFGGQL